MKIKFLIFNILISVFSFLSVVGQNPQIFPPETISIDEITKKHVTRLWPFKDVILHNKLCKISKEIEKENIKYILQSNDTIFVAMIGVRNFLNHNYLHLKSESRLRKKLKKIEGKNEVPFVGSYYAEPPNCAYVVMNTDTLLYEACGYESDIYLEYASVASNFIDVFKFKIGRNIDCIFRSIGINNIKELIPIDNPKYLILTTFQKSYYKNIDCNISCPYILIEFKNLLSYKIKFVDSKLNPILFKECSSDYSNYYYTDFWTESMN